MSDERGWTGGPAALGEPLAVYQAPVVVTLAMEHPLLEERQSGARARVRSRHGPAVLASLEGVEIDVLVALAAGPEREFDS